MNTSRCLHALLLAVGAWMAACTTTSVETRSVGGTPTDLRLRPSVVVVDEVTLEPDRVRRLHDLGTPAALQARVNQYLQEGGLLGGELRLEIEINVLRLPLTARALTAQFKGNDYLGARVRISDMTAPVFTADVSAQLGAGDRSISEDRSAYRAHETLVEMLSWEIAWAVTGASGRRGEEEILAAGKHNSVPRAIIVLAHRGRLSYAEFLKYAAEGSIPAENLGSAVKYDVCLARRVLTLGLSGCKWDPDYR